MPRYMVRWNEALCCSAWVEADNKEAVEAMWENGEIEYDQVLRPIVIDDSLVIEEEDES